MITEGLTAFSIGLLLYACIGVFRAIAKNRKEERIAHEEQMRKDMEYMLRAGVSRLGPMTQKEIDYDRALQELDNEFPGSE